MVTEYFPNSNSLKLLRRYAHPGAGLVLVFLAPVRGGQGLVDARVTIAHAVKCIIVHSVLSDRDTYFIFLVAFDNLNGIVSLISVSIIYVLLSGVPSNGR